MLRAVDVLNSVSVSFEDNFLQFKFLLLLLPMPQCNRPGFQLQFESLLPKQKRSLLDCKNQQTDKGKERHQVQSEKLNSCFDQGLHLLSTFVPFSGTTTPVSSHPALNCAPGLNTPNLKLGHQLDLL